MFETGQNVLYGINGVCLVEGVTEKKIGKVTLEYYVLKPLSSNMQTLFVPVKNEQLVKRIRPVLSREEIEAILSDLPEIGEWNEDKNERTEQFKSIVYSADCKELIGMIRLIKARAAELIKTGRSLHMSDDRLLKEAEKMVTEEVALALGIEKQEVMDIILK